MGAGKSTLGRALESSCVSLGAPSLPGCRFIDLDDEIGARAGLTVTEIFATRGEEAFRQLEADTLQAVTDGALGRGGLTVVATGGGTPCRPGAMELMNSAGLTVWLEASEERLLNRLWLESAKRPLIAGKLPGDILGVMRAQRAARAPFYSRAQARFCSDLLENEAEIAATVTEFTKKFITPYGE